LLVKKAPPIILKWRQDLTDSGQEGIEAQEKVCSELKHTDVICLTEHWQSYQELISTNIVDFKLVSAFCSSSSEHGGSGIYVKDGLKIKEITNFAGISE
jgi:predicted outer membrane repeat protein